MNSQENNHIETEILEILESHPEGISIGKIHELMDPELPYRSLRNHLKKFVDGNKIVLEGERKKARYYLPLEFQI